MLTVCKALWQRGFVLHTEYLVHLEAALVSDDLRLECVGNLWYSNLEAKIKEGRGQLHI